MAIFAAMSELQVYNTLSRKLETFQPINAPFVGMYVCGPTVYSEVHIGNVRTFVSFDLIYRYLKFLGYKVRYVRNITDVGHLLDDSEEDKITRKARLENIEPMEVVQRYTVDFHQTMQAFNTLSPSIEPTATGHLIEQIDLIQRIVDSGLGYESNGSVYFDVQAYNEKEHYGILSGRNIEELISNTRDTDGQEDKRSPLDFAIWKKADPQHIMKWPSPWSVGFPGWHLECSAMSTKYLGTTFDIHGGGMDLKFPHHECEIAQAKAGYGHEPVKYWLHTNMLTFNGRKMAKSEGTGVTPRQLITGDHPLLSQAYDPMTIRFFMLQAHYRSTLDFSDEALQAADKGYRRLMQAIADLDTLQASQNSSLNVAELTDRVKAAMDDDFNSPIAIAHCFEAVKWVNLMKEGKESLNNTDLQSFRNFFKEFVAEVLGLTAASAGESVDKIDGLMQMLIDMRQQAKTARDFATADSIRDQLLELGFVIKDGKEGTTYTMK
ncbi:MAG: cysteine--tRNA ligase [Flavobacteriales bacterium]|nr:cysteine--tRNA ligase [Flavobacteriales bacterium]